MNRSLFIACLIVFISRLPFLSDGFGHEEDSWGLALNAMEMYRTGEYSASRLPGHPLQEYMYAGIGKDPSPILFNLLSAFFSTIAVFFFGKIASRLQIPKPWMASLLLGMVPVFFAASTYSIDYVWAAAFALGGGYFFIQQKIPLAGIMFGLAMACRITSGAWLICFIPLAGLPLNSGQLWRNTLIAGIICAITGLLFYIPVIMKYGPAFFMYYDQFPYPHLIKLLYKMSLGVWGILGITALGIFLFPALRTKTGNPAILTAFLLAAVLFTIAYLRLPQKSGYLIPMIPFALLFFLDRLKSRALNIFTVLIVLSPWCMGINLTDNLRGADSSALAVTFRSGGQEIFFDPVSGPVFNETSKRRNKLDFTDRVIASLDELKPSGIICGWWYNELAVKMKDDPRRSLLVFYAGEEEMKQMSTSGSVYFLPEQDTYNDLYSSIQSTNRYASAFPIK
ncbi:MAG: hypothetical protein IT233_11715 [Bacteroidia bacterium]|nr:hypothetical protein [Bacteroidia bacterium]